LGSEYVRIHAHGNVQFHPFDPRAGVGGDVHHVLRHVLLGCFIGIVGDLCTPVKRLSVALTAPRLRYNKTGRKLGSR
jgi:hypothetical protein